MEQITSRANPLMTHVRKLIRDRKLRRSENQMVGEGPKMLEEALRWGAKLETVFWAPGIERMECPEGVRQIEIPKSLLRDISSTQTPQGVLFLCALPTQPFPEALPGSRYLVLDGLQDPGNVGTLWRTADAFGADGLILLPGCADPWNPKTLRASMGACFRLPLWETELEPLTGALARGRIPLYATALGETAVDIQSCSLCPAAVVIGSEGQGVSRRVLTQCEETLRIPMRPRCESLNAAAAGAVVLWEMGRQSEGGLAGG